MKHIECIINLYGLEELDTFARNRAIDDHRNFLLSEMKPDDFISGDPDYDTPEKLKEAYNAEYEYYLYNDDVIIESIEINDYLFFEDGEFASTCTYTAGENAGKTFVKYHGKTYEAHDEVLSA